MTVAKHVLFSFLVCLVCLVGLSGCATRRDPVPPAAGHVDDLPEFVARLTAAPSAGSSIEIRTQSSEQSLRITRLDDAFRLTVSLCPEYESQNDRHLVEVADRMRIEPPRKEKGGARCGALRILQVSADNDEAVRLARELLARVLGALEFEYQYD